MHEQVSLAAIKWQTNTVKHHVGLGKAKSRQRRPRKKEAFHRNSPSDFNLIFNRVSGREAFREHIFRLFHETKTSRLFWEIFLDKFLRFYDLDTSWDFLRHLCARHFIIPEIIQLHKNIKIDKKNEQEHKTHVSIMEGRFSHIKIS